MKTESRRMTSAGLTFYHIGVCTVTLNHLFQDVRFNVLCNRRVNHDVPCISSVPEYAVHFNTECFHFGNIYEEEI